MEQSSGGDRNAWPPRPQSVILTTLTDVRAELSGNARGVWRVTIHNDGPAPIKINVDGAVRALDAEGKFQSGPNVHVGVTGLELAEIEPGASWSRVVAPQLWQFAPPGVAGKLQHFQTVVNAGLHVLTAGRYWFVGYYSASVGTTRGRIATNLLLGEVSSEGIGTATAVSPE